MMRDVHDDAGAGASGAMEENEGGGSGGAEVDMDECGSLALPPDLPPYSGDYIISDYMERLGTRLNILETELKYAWRALDLLSQEYVRMWERLERLETLLADQQGVISTLLDFYTCRTVTSRDSMTRLEVIREILGNGTVEDGIEEGLDIGRSVLIDPQDEVMESDEAFYKSLNQAYRDDLVCEENSIPNSQLDMIWEAPEEPDIELMPTTSRQIYSANDYKDYCGLQDGHGISERDLVHLSTLSTIDQITVDKLHELDRLTTQLHKGSRELKDLKTRLLNPEKKLTSKHDPDIEANALVEDGNIIDEQLKNIYSGGENWGISDMMKSFDDFVLTVPKDTISRDKSPSRLSLTDSTSERQLEYLPTNLSPRRKFVPERTTTEPYTTVTGRLAYSSAVANAEINAAKSSKSPSALSRERFDYSSNYPLTDVSRQSYFSPKTSSQGFDEVYKTVPEQHSPLSVHNVYDNPIDSRLDLSFEDTRLHKSPSPPPPAPPNGVELFPSIDNNNELPSRQSMLSTGSITTENMRLSPRSPKSPKTSPKFLKRDATNIVAAKSDSGLSSMSGWSSLEKSPGSPKTSRLSHGNYESHKLRISSPQAVQKLAYEIDSKPYLETLVDSYTLESTVMKSDYTLRKNENIKDISDSNDLAVLQNKIDEEFLKTDSSYANQAITNMSEYYYGNEVPSIYSVAGNRQPIFTTVYSTPRGTLAEDRSFSEILDRNDMSDSISKPTIDSYPPEPSYHAQTVATNITKKPLVRANTLGGNDPHFYQNGYKPTNHRSGYPSGNITDALSYYPTSSRYDSPKRPSLDDQLSWQGGSKSPTSSIETSSMKSRSLSINERRHFQNQLQQEYFKQQQYDQRNGNVICEMQEYEKPIIDHSSIRKEQFVDSSGILVSESGYLSISSNLKLQSQEKSSKKPKRTSSLRSAMSSMSQWLPDLHLPKKHRSHSLPSGVDTVEQQQQEKSLKERILSAQRRKKKYHLVASMSGLLQKARRKQQTSHQSLSDPETSETEWSGGRSSAQSEDSDSVFSDSTHEGNVFAKVPVKQKRRKSNNQEIVEQQQLIQELQQQGVEFNDDSVESILEEKDMYTSASVLPRDKSDDIDFHFARVSQMNKDNISDIEKLDIDTDISNIDPFEEHQKDDDQSPSSIFATIGDVKKAAAVSDDSTNENNKSYSGSSQEFAVSRALGKYRLRKSSSVSDDQIDDKSPPKIEASSHDDPQEELSNQKDKKHYKPCAPEIVNGSTHEETVPYPERSPSIQSARSVPNKFSTRHQQSLDIPNKHDDDDSRSTHSWRSGSRVSSRRQSTEDSIDSEDEWYCYELRKLEEMEHQSQQETDREETLMEEPEEDFSTEPNEVLKEKMSFVLQELQLKTATIKEKYDEDPSKKAWKDITTFPIIEDRPTVVEPDEEKEYDEDKSYADSGSGETSGPDSPVQSGDEFDDDYEMPQIHEESQQIQEPPPQQEAQVGSKWKLLKALKDRKAEEKTTETPAATTPSTEKDKVSAGVSYLMQKFHEIRVKS